MTSHAPLRPCSFLVVLLFASYLLLGSLPATDARGGSPAESPISSLPHLDPTTRTLTREEDPVILHGKDLPGMLARPISGLRAFAVRNGRMSPIPYQVDEFDKKGRIVSTEGSHPGKDEDNGRIDDNDELVIMASDLGDRAPVKLFPSASRAGAEVEVRDGRTGGNGWFYVFDFDSPPAPSPISYVHYDPKNDLVETSRYRVEFNAKNPVLLDDMHIKNATGDPGPNVIDRIKMRTVLKSRLYLTFHFKEDDITSRIPAYKNGPIRAVRVGEFYIKLLFLKVTPSGYVDYLFYRNAVVGPSEVKLPFSPKLLLRGGSGSVGGLDFDSSVYGWKFYSELNPAPVTVNGETKEGPGLHKKGVSWFGIYGPDRGTMMRIVYGESLRKARLDYDLYYLDDKTVEDKPEREKGETLIGFYTDVMQIPRGNHKMWFYQFFASPYLPGEEQKFNDILDHPLVVQTQAVSIPSLPESRPTQIH